MTIHLDFRKGQRVFVKLKNGDTFVDQYDEKKSRYIVLRERGKIQTGDLQSVTIFRNQVKRE